MAITFVGQSSAASDTLTLPPHQAGDLIVVYAYNSAAAVVPAIPATGFTSISSLALAGNTQGQVVAWKFATSSSETVGSWVGATLISAVVYRGVKSPPIGATNTLNTTLDVTFSATTGSGGASSVFLAMFGRRAGTGATADAIVASENNPPTGLVCRCVQLSGLAALGLYEQSGVANFSEKVIPSTSGTRYRSNVVELLAANEPASPISGQSAIALGALSSASSANLPIKAQSSGVLSALSLSSSGRVSMAGEVAVTLGALTAEISAGSASGASAFITLGSLSALSAGALSIEASAALELGSLASSSAGSNQPNGSAGGTSVTLGPLSLFATGDNGQDVEIIPRSIVSVLARVFSFNVNARHNMIITPQHTGRREVVIGTWSNKYPDERFSNQIDWTQLLEGATITDSSADLHYGVVDIPSQSFDGAIQTVWIEGGEVGRVSIRCQIATSDGRILEVDARFNVIG